MTRLESLETEWIKLFVSLCSTEIDSDQIAARFLSVRAITKRMILTGKATVGEWDREYFDAEIPAKHSEIQASEERPQVQQRKRSGFA